MIALLLLAATPAGQPVETAERAFAAMAQRQGQWAAFRAFAAPDAIMMLDGPQKAAPFLKDRKDPPVSVRWWPARTVTSCDGMLAFSSGPYRQLNGGGGTFFTIWRKQPDRGWRWIYDGGSSGDPALPDTGRTNAVRASCGATIPIIVSNAVRTGGTAKDGSLDWMLKGSSEWSSAGPYRLVVRYNGGAGVVTAVDTIVGD